MTSEPVHFDLPLPPLTLEAGARLPVHVVRGFAWGPKRDAELIALRALRLDRAEVARAVPVRRSLADARSLEAAYRSVRAESVAASAPLDPSVPTIVVVHALTGDARAAAESGWWAPLVGPGKPIDPTRARVLCFNLLGSCYGTTGPADEGFPSAAEDARAEPVGPIVRGDPRFDPAKLPATITTWDQARSILMALDALGIERVELAAGGSLGGMVVLALASLAPERFARIAPIATTAKSSAWVIGWNHPQRRAIVDDPGFPASAERGLALARQLAMVSYRAEPGFDASQGRGQVGAEGWNPRAPYAIATYLEHQGHKLVGRFDARAYLALMGAIDHHDLDRAPPSAEPVERWRVASEARAGSLEAPTGWGGVGRVTARAHGAYIDSDALYWPAQTNEWVARINRAGGAASAEIIRSPHGHDAFLIEWAALGGVLRRALELPVSERGGGVDEAPAAE
jgi:homoserine O-acetyltransferase